MTSKEHFHCLTRLIFAAQVEGKMLHHVTMTNWLQEELQKVVTPTCTELGASQRREMSKFDVV